jgi:ubiquinone/menaquinone biosynthesis C-methylase UbiE
MQISRVTRSKSAAKNAYDRMSPIYDWMAGSSETPLMKAGLKMLGVQAGEIVLEIGPGTGKALIDLYRSIGETGWVYGLDLSLGMLHQAQHRLVQNGLTKRAGLIEGDGTRLPYCNSSFHAVFLSFTLELFDTPEIPLVLGECRRVLIEGGRLGVVSMLKTEVPSRIARLYEWFHEYLPTYVDCRPIEAHTMIEATGFIIDHHQIKSMWGLPVEMVIARKSMG